MSRPVAVVSVDVDPVDLHLVGYGFRGLAPDSRVMEVALPRLLGVLSRARVPATLFIVARDAEAHAGTLRQAVASGHEIASHTWSHPLRFAGLPAAAQEMELRRSKAALEAAAGAAVVGFRAPNFDMDPRALARLADCGYQYDASGYPSLMLLPARLLLALKSRSPAEVLSMSPWPFTWRRQPYRWSKGGVALSEYPVAVTPGLRLPVYHTLRHYTSDAAFERRLDGFAKRGEMLSYVLHGVDVLGAVEDAVDPRLAKHPGMERPLDRKLATLERTLAALAARFELRTYASLPAPSH